MPFVCQALRQARLGFYAIPPALLPTDSPPFDVFSLSSSMYCIHCIH